MESATFEISAVVILSLCGFFKHLRKLELWDRLMMKRNFIFGHESWQMCRCVYNANVSLLEMLEWNINRIIGVSEVATFRGRPCLNIFRVDLRGATVELLGLLSFAHDSLHFLTIRKLNPASR